MKSAFYLGRVGHRRYLPRTHSFSYPFFMWLLNLDQIEQVRDMGLWFSVRRFALNRFLRSDYLGDAGEPLHISVKNNMERLTGKPVSGEVCGLLNLRTLGLYFSPVNFYFGYDDQGRCTHMLAEVSNTPWNERHLYAHDMTAEEELTNAKAFHVSPFNPINQTYRWEIDPPEEHVRVKIEVHDQRGFVFEAQIQLKKRPLELKAIRWELLKRPVMTALVMLGIYWQALKIYLKRIPFIPYGKEIS